MYGYRDQISFEFPSLKMKRLRELWIWETQSVWTVQLFFQPLKMFGTTSVNKEIVRWVSV